MANFEQGGGDGLRPFNVPIVFGSFYPDVPVGVLIIPCLPPPPYAFPAYALPESSTFPLPGPSTFVPPTTQGIDPLKIDEYVGKRLIAHINNGSMICGVLRCAYPNGNLLLSEAIQASYRGPKMVLGKVQVRSGTFPLICAYHSCGASCIFPLTCDMEVLLPDSYQRKCSLTNLNVLAHYLLAYKLTEPPMLISIHWENHAFYLIILCLIFQYLCAQLRQLNIL